MKYWFFLILLANIVFFLWEFHYGALEVPETPPSTEKQILLLSEVPRPSDDTQQPESAPAENAQIAPAQPGSSPLSSALQLGGETPGNVTISSAAAETPAGQPMPPALAENVQTVTQPTTTQLSPDAAQAGSENPVSEPEKAPEEAVENPAVIAQTTTVNTVTAEAEMKPSTMPENTQSAMDQAPQPAPAAIQAGGESPVPAEEPAKSVGMQTSCYALGIVKNAEALHAVLDRYRSQLDTLQLSKREKRKNDSYLVYFPAGATMEESIATAEMLRNEHGISDLLVFRSGELKGAISLGVYSNEQRAKTAQSQLEAKGVRAKIMPRFPLETSYVVRLRWNELQDAAARQMAETLKKNYPAIQKAASCE